MMLPQLFNAIFILCIFGYIRSYAEPVAIFPLQFSASVTITAHLIEEESSYPPRLRRMTILYDYIGKIGTSSDLHRNKTRAFISYLLRQHL